MSKVEIFLRAKNYMALVMAVETRPETKKFSFILNRFLMQIEIKTHKSVQFLDIVLFCFSKNKKQRMMVRAAVLKMKDPKQIIRDMEKLDEMGKDL